MIGVNAECCLACLMEIWGVMAIILKELFTIICWRFKCVLLNSSIISALLFSLPVFASSGDLPAGVVVSFEVVKSAIEVNDQALVIVTYTNEGNSAVKLLKRDTALGGGMTEDLFSVEYQGRELAYSGAHVKRLAPVAADYIELGPNESVSQKIDLLRSYSIDFEGDYVINLREVSSDHSVDAKSLPGKVLSLSSDRPVQLLKRTPQFENCSASQQSVIDSALTSAERIANESISALRNAPVALRPNAERYLEWFGTYSASRYAQVESGMARIASATSNQTIGFDCDCTNQPGVNPANTFAFVFTNDPFNMTLCDVFFIVPREGTDSQSGTIVHEISHFNVVASTDDFSSALDQRGSRSLANSSPANAIRNANAFEYFAENTPFLTMPVAVPPTDFSLSGLVFEDLPLSVSNVETLTGQVDNLGQNQTLATTVSLTLTGNGGGVLLGQAGVPSIAVGGSSSFSIDFEAPDQTGFFAFEVCLANSDDNTTNNCLSLFAIEVIDRQVIISPILPLLLDD